MSNARITIRDVAAAVGLSPTTVSHALPGKGRGDPAPRERGAETAQQLGYRPARTARRLRSGRSGAIALLLPFVEPDIARDEMLALDYYMHPGGSAAGAALGRAHPGPPTPPLRDVDDLHDLG